MVAPASVALAQSINHVADERRTELAGQAASAYAAIGRGRKAYKALGKDPARYRLSAEALLRRVGQDKPLYQVNNVVDCNTLISISSALSIGAYDLEQLDGTITFRKGQPGESYDGIGRGPINLESLPIFADEAGPFGSPTSDSERSKVTEATRRLLMVLIDFGSPEEGLDQAVQQAISALQDYCDASDVESWTVTGGTLGLWVRGMSEEARAVTPPVASMRTMVAVIACMTVFALILGLTYPLLAFILDDQGVSESLVGLNAAMAPLGIIMTAPLLPYVLKLTRAWQIVCVSVFAAALCLLLIGLFQNLYAWFPLRFLLGVFINVAFVASETWINILVSPAVRGRVLGIYTMAFSSGFALGPLMLVVTGTESLAPFIIGAALALAAMVPVYLSRQALPDFEPERGAFLTFLGLAPRLLIVVGVLAAFDQISFSFLPLYGLGKGFDEVEMSIALAIFVTGNTAVQPLIGWLIDRISLRFVSLLCTSMTVICSLLLPFFASDLWLFYGLLFVLGGFAFGLYTVSLTELGRRFTGGLLLAGNAAFGAMWGIGGIIGPPITGESMERFGPEGLPGLVALLFFALTLMLFFRRSFDAEEKSG